MKKNTIIIVEGANQCGKTTLINNIIKEYSELNFQYIKCNQPKNNYAYKEYCDILNNIIANPNNYVIDRFHLGSEVYGPLYRNKPDMTKEDFNKIEIKIMTMGNQYNIIPIIALSDEEFVKEKHLELKEEYLKFEDIEREHDLFKRIVKKSKLNWFLHNIQNHNMWEEKYIHRIIANGNNFLIKG